MNPLEVWQSRNNDYLSAALAWLRLRLDVASSSAHVPTARSAPSATATVEKEETFIQGFFHRARPADAELAKEVPRLPGPDHEMAMKARLELATQELASASAGDPPPALWLLSRRLGFSDFERDILLLCAAMELDTRISALCARVHEDPGRSFPTFALAMAVFDNPAWEALSPERPLRYWRLLEINQPGAQPLTTSALRADERVVSYIKGLNYLDDRLAPLVVPMAPAVQDDMPASQREAVRRIVEHLTQPSCPVAQIALSGRDRESKQLVARAAALSLGLHLYRLPVDSLPAHPGELETLARLWQRECLLLPLALYLDAHEVGRSTAAESPLDRFVRLISGTGGLLFVDSRDGFSGAGDSSLALEVHKPTPTEQQSLWASALGEEAVDLPSRLAGQFNLNMSEIQSIANRAVPGEGASSRFDLLWRGCLERTRPALGKLAERLDTKATWEHIVLPNQEAALLRQIAAQVDCRTKVYDDWGFRSRMNRGFGISALFAGDSGTGKTMAAEVLANALQLDLYRIDLSAVVSKYIGETEKNLRQVFDAAEDGGAILLFDEADALFGRRSEVKDAHDRYSNIEINYLLQRMEAYRGLAILATNMKSALDAAFMRRLRFVINFPFPGPEERKLIWQKAFPRGMPLGHLDFERLARLNLSGGNIHSVALNAAFLAAEADVAVTMKHLFEAGRIEFRKLDRPVNESDLRWVEPAEVAG